jgi:hypothetical protein
MDDLTHYMEATSRLRAEVERLSASALTAAEALYCKGAVDELVDSYRPGQGPNEEQTAILAKLSLTAEKPVP